MLIYAGHTRSGRNVRPAELQAVDVVVTSYSVLTAELHHVKALQ